MTVSPHSRKLRMATAVNEDEQASIEALAEIAGVNVSTYLRVAALSSHGGYVAQIAELQARCDKAERALIEIVHTVKRVTDGAS